VLRGVAAGCLVHLVLGCAFTAEQVAERSGTPGGAGPPPSPLAGWAVGERVTGRLEYANTTASDAGVLLAPTTAPDGPAPRSALSSEIGSQLQAELSLTVLARDAGGVDVLVRFLHPAVVVRIDGEDLGVQVDSVTAQLSRPMWIRLTPEGAIARVGFSPSVQPLARSFARTILAALQVVTPPGGTPALELPRVWEAREEDPVGVARVRYEAIDRAGRVFRRSRLDYGAAAAPGRRGEIVLRETIHPGGSVLVRLDARGRVASLVGSETLTVAVGGRPIASGETTVSWRRSDVARARPGTPSTLRAATDVAWEPLFERATEDEADHALYRAELGAETTGSLLRALAEVEAREPTGFDTPLYLKLKALVFLRPQESEVLGELLARAPAGGATMLMVAGALGAIGHPEAQLALVGAIRSRPHDWPALATLVPALGGVPLPILQAERTLLALAFDEHAAEPVAWTARLALGTAARRLGWRLRNGRRRSSSVWSPASPRRRGEARHPRGSWSSATRVRSVRFPPCRRTSGTPTRPCGKPRSRRCGGWTRVWRIPSWQLPSCMMPILV
jgi:hypothetical protein